MFEFVNPQCCPSDNLILSSPLTMTDAPMAAGAILKSIAEQAGFSCSVVDLNISDNNNLATINLSGLVTIYGGDFTIYKNPVLSSIIGLSSLIYIGSSNFGITHNALPSTFINSFLNKLLTVAPATGKYLSLDTQTPPAPPTGQGIIDKQTLITTGNSVSTD